MKLVSMFIMARWKTVLLSTIGRNSNQLLLPPTPNITLLFLTPISLDTGNDYPKISTSVTTTTVQLTNPLSLIKNEDRPKLQSQFSKVGFAVFPNVLNLKSVDVLNDRLEHVLRGNYDRKQRPDKIPKMLNLALPPGTAASSASFLEGDGIPVQRRKRRRRQRRGQRRGHQANNQHEQDGDLNNESSQETNGMNKSQYRFARRQRRGQQPNNQHEKEGYLNNNESSQETNGIHKSQYRSAASGPLGYSGNKQKKVLQIINIRKSDTMFQELVTSPILGELVATLMGWKDGARLAQDQIWAKPPGAPPLAYHRDSPYFMFNPSSVATVWIALDTMTEDIGPLTYICSSHKWGDGVNGSIQQFFEEKGGKSLVHSAAERAGCIPENLEYVSLAGLEAGGLSIHDGRTWHGSGGNVSDPHRVRRGIGLHFVPVGVRWTEHARRSKLWSGYVNEAIENGEDVAKLELDEDDFPVTWSVRNTNDGQDGKLNL